MGKLRHRVVKLLAQGPTVNKRESNFCSYLLKLGTLIKNKAKQKEQNSSKKQNKKQQQ